MLKKYSFSVILMLLYYLTAVSQTPCVNGMAGQYPCKDYDLMSQIPISVLATTAGNPEGSDIWGWTDPATNKEYAIVGTTNSTAFVDISDPVNPIFLGRIKTVNNKNSFWRDVKVYNNHAFIVADNTSNHGMQVFDLTILRQGVNPDLTYTSAVNDGNVLRYQGDNGITIGSCHNIVINETKGFAYLVGCGTTANGGPIFIDISNPMQPTAVGSYSNKGYTHDAQVITYNGPDTDYTGREILVASNGTQSSTNKVVILDVTNKSNPQFISEITYPQSYYAHQGWFTDDHRHFIFGDEIDETSIGSNTKTFVVDMSDLDAPELSSTYTSNFPAIDHNGYVKGNEFFLSNYTAGLRVFDITNIAAPTNAMTETGFFDSYPSNNGASYNGVWSIYPYFKSGNIIISDINSGLLIVKKSNLLSIENFEEETIISLAPNPTTSSTTVTSNTPINTIKIFSVLGQKVYEKNNINTKTFVLPINSYKRGVYLVKINNSTTKKLVIK